MQKCCADYSVALEELLDFNCDNLSISEHSIKAEFCPTSLPGSSRFKIKRIYGSPPHPTSLNCLRYSNSDREPCAPGLAEFTLGWGCGDLRKTPDLKDGGPGS